MKQYVNLQIDTETLAKADKKAELDGRSRKKTLEMIIEESLRNS